MPVQATSTEVDTPVQPVVEVRFDLIRRRAAEVLDINHGEPTLQELADLFGLSLKQVWRFSKGIATPSSRTAMHIAQVLDMKVEDFIKPKDGAQ